MPPSKTFLDNGGVSVESTREQAAAFQSGLIASYFGGFFDHSREDEMSNSGSAVVGRHGMEIGQLEFVGEPIVFRGWPDAMNLIEIDDRMRVAVLHLDAAYRVRNSRFSDADRSVEEDAVNHPTRLSQPLRRTLKQVRCRRSTFR